MLKREMSFKKFFTLMVGTVVLVSMIATTVIQVWCESRELVATRESYQELVANLVVNSLREPILQGSFVEARERAKGLLQNKQVACLSIYFSSSPVLKCTESELKTPYINKTQRTLKFTDNSSAIAGNIDIYFDNSDVRTAVENKILNAIITNLITALLMFFIFIYSSRVVQRELRVLLSSCDPLQNKGTESNETMRISEFAYVFRELKKYIATSKTMAEIQAANEVAHQVAHDIRSPLAALRMTVESMSSLIDEKKRTLFSAIERINDIANDLVSKAPTSSPKEDTNSSVKPELISVLVDQIVSEKRMQYRERSGITFRLSITRQAHLSFSKISNKEFKRSLSNILDNSAEAMKSSGIISIDVDVIAGMIAIQVKDNGIGIPNHIIPQLMQKGQSYGKPNGNGLGLYSSKRNIETWNGQVEISSELNVGTTLKIQLPLCSPPSWFAQKISFQSRMQIIIVEDDLSIHQGWRERIEPLQEMFSEIEVLNFSSTDEFVTWYNNSSLSNTERVFLVDFEFLKQRKTGLEIIKELDLADKAILVTSRFEDPEIQKDAISLNLKILPKNIAGYVPFEVSA